MSNKEELKRFLADTKNNKELAEKMEAALKELKDSGITKNEALEKVAKDNGYAISAEDLDALEVEGEKLDDDELDKVSGGWCWSSDEWCIASDKHIIPMPW
ncbi:MAG: Nif11-like leader peptide family natural product precursor [Lachnospiraceae bacterium]|nr:Nif11-like leader peptide family natural product precursor [Lachnospiraceae bacterium]